MLLSNVCPTGGTNGGRLTPEWWSRRLAVGGRLPLPRAGGVADNEALARGERAMRPNPVRAMVGGFVGTVVMTAMMYVVAPMMGLNMDIAQMLGSMLGNSWMAGMMMHVVNGTVIFPLIYAYVLYAWLPGGPVTKGLGWGVILWFLAQVVVMPMMGGGLFSSAMGGMMAAGGSLMGHLLYGGILGAIAGAGELRRAPVSA